MNTADTKPVVLLIEDSIDIHRLVKARLRHENVEVITADSGADGIATAHLRRPAAILLDLEMAGMDGFEVLRALKSKVETNTIPVIILSGLRQTDDKVTAFDLGAADFVTKSFDDPSDVAELKARLRAVLRTERLLRLLAERAEIDGLTGLGNRTQLNRRWTEEVATNRRYGHPLTLAMLDIDHFKRVNDNFGHPAGDELLTGFSRLIQGSIRTMDVACRFGGEEFAIIMPSTMPADALIVAERIRAGLASAVWPRHPEHNVTVSIGLCGCDGNAGEVTPEQWLEFADKALFAAKHRGRNKVVTDDSINARALTKA